MKTYVIGDLQGCSHETGLLLERIAAAGGAGARILFAGDLINRGPDSLGALRRVYRLALDSGGRVDAILGNHDLHLLAVSQGMQPESKSDTLREILDAPDCGELMAWLRQRPLAIWHAGHLVLHAGALPQWDVEQTMALAGEVEAVLRGDGWTDFLRDMYGNEPDHWDDALAGMPRLRCITNALTRMRLCSASGVMNFKDKEGVAANRDPALMPWFEVPGRKTAHATVVFGHWSALGLLIRDKLVGLDSGCVWGGKLSAVCLDDRALIQVDCPEYKPHGGKRK